MKKLKHCFAIALIFITAQNMTAQDLAPDSSWTVTGFGAANFNQVSFTNWAAGGDNSISFTLVGFMQANYAKKRHNWNNVANVLYGILRTDEFGLRKNDDKLEFESKYGYILNKKNTALLTAIANFRSQVAPGFNFPNDSIEVSKFAAPGYMTIGLGIDWKPADYFSLFVSPVTGKFTFVRDQDIANTGLYGNKAGVPITDTLGEIIGYSVLGNKHVNQFGAYLNARFQKEVVKNVTIQTKLELFQNYTGDTDASKMVDVNWEGALLFKINAWLSASFTWQMIYDKEILIPHRDRPEELSDRLQFKQALGIGLTYKFDNNKRTGRAE